MLGHCFNRLVHHEIGVSLQIFCFYIEKLIKINFFLQYDIDFIRLLFWVFTSLIQLLECSISPNSKKKTSYMRLNLLSHLITFSLSDTSFSSCSNFLRILNSAKPSTNPFLKKSYLF